ncbi:MAG: sporulation protein [Methanomicrobiales archaeon]|nr:sporulation protein [Methanomicrobiales archaeon]
MLKTMVDELDKLINANTVVGDAIDAGDKTIIPIAGFGFGFGAGEGTGGDKCGGGAGSGAGGSVSPVAIVIVHKDLKGPESVQVLSLKKTNPVSEIIGTLGETVIPQVADVVKSTVGREKAKKEQAPADIPVTDAEDTA